ncbi:BTB/POZ domain-containing protein [Cavenderia fasciculata]|uniref:BTB/POZ domain-containing protein n=1 Tax=Cavenderia fasciculata TaxID=261658 RepID=F4PPY5_CACFS|nr:BTB/POZ domain-containing protein [Cavenderia fasciculata]EGG22448.1 BTB/POZ domain-containing protein [Cavenderia fasciculata]|eukprot:XP_004360299.1 BTB/POZ domain-containing protein [Cavenderia fasciculata]
MTTMDKNSSAQVDRDQLLPSTLVSATLSSSTSTSLSSTIPHAYHHSPRSVLNQPTRTLLAPPLTLINNNNNNNKQTTNTAITTTTTQQQQQQKKKSNNKKKMNGSDSDDDSDLVTLTRAAHELDIKNFQFDYTNSSCTASNSSQSEDIELMVRSTSLRKKYYNYGNGNGSLGHNQHLIRPPISTMDDDPHHQSIIEPNANNINTVNSSSTSPSEPSSLKSNSSSTSTSSTSSLSPNSTPPINSLPPNNNNNFDTVTPNTVNNHNINHTMTASSVTNLQPQQQKRNNNYNKIMIGGVEIDRSTPVNFNVGGSIFATSLNSILKCRNSVLYKIVEMQINVVAEDDTIFIDRNPNYFSCILDFLRTDRYFSPVGINTKGLLMEAEFFGIEELAAAIRDEPEITRSDIINLINSCYDYPRFRGLWLTKLNLSGLDLSCALFEFANLSKSIIKSTNVQSANFVGSNLEGCFFDSNYGIGVKFSNAKVYNATFTNNVLYETIAYNTNFNGSDLRGTKFACSDLSGSKFTNCKLEGCDFSHCDLTEVHFTGSTFDKSSNLSCSTIKDSTIFDNTNHEVAIRKKGWKKPKTIRNRSKVLSTIPGMG